MRFIAVPVMALLVTVTAALVVPFLVTGTAVAIVAVAGSTRREYGG